MMVILGLYHAAPCTVECVPKFCPDTPPQFLPQETRRSISDGLFSTTVQLACERPLSLQGP